MPPIGQLKNLTVGFNNVTRKLDCLVISGSEPSLIGREWLKAFGLWPLQLSISYVNEIKKIDILDARRLRVKI